MTGKMLERSFVTSTSPKVLMMAAAAALGVAGCSAGAIEGSGDGPAGSGEAQLAWDAASAGASELAGYRVYVGTAPAAYDDSIDVANVTQYRVTGLASGVKYYFAVTAYDTSSNE